jgi:cell division protein FtsQ
MTAAVLKRGARPPKARSARRPAVSAAADLPRPTRRQLAIGSGAVLALALIVMILIGVPQRLWMGFVTWTAANGWEVRHVELTGAREQDRLAIYGAVLNGPTNAMLATDLDDVRARLTALPWVADASVQRRLPDTLVIEVIERKPVALWQHHRHLYAVDLTGKVLTDQRLERWNDLPLLVGAGANRHVKDALTLLAATALGREVDAAVFVGGRRWDLRFRSGETLALPDQPGQARAALARLARLDGQGPDRLLGGRFTRFDMRLPGRMIVAGPAVAASLAEAEKARRAAAQARAI